MRETDGFDGENTRAKLSKIFFKGVAKALPEIHFIRAMGIFWGSRSQHEHQIVQQTILNRNILEHFLIKNEDLQVPFAAIAKVVCINKGNSYVENLGEKDTIDLVLCGVLKKSKNFQIKSMQSFTREHNEGIYKKPLNLVALPDPSESSIKFLHGYKAEETTYLISIKIGVWRQLILNTNEQNILAYSTYLMRQEFFGFDNPLQPIKLFLNSKKIRTVKGGLILKKGQSTESCIYFILKGSVSLIEGMNGDDLGEMAQFQKPLKNKRKIILTTISAFDFFGEEGYFGGQKTYPFTIVVESSECLILKVDIRDLKEIDKHLLLKLKGLAIDRQESRRTFFNKKTSFLNSFYKKKKSTQNPKNFDPRNIVSIAQQSQIEKELDIKKSKMLNSAIYTWKQRDKILKDFHNNRKHSRQVSMDIKQPLTYQRTPIKSQNHRKKHFSSKSFKLVAIMDKSTIHDPKYVPDQDFIEESSCIHKNASLSRRTREKMDYNQKMGKLYSRSQSKGKIDHELKKSSLSRVLSPHNNKHLKMLRKKILSLSSDCKSQSRYNSGSHLGQEYIQSLGIRKSSLGRINHYGRSKRRLN